MFFQSFKICYILGKRSRSNVSESGNWFNGVWNLTVDINLELLQGSTRTDWDDLPNSLINVYLIPDRLDTFV
ncbi:unnamed protein product [Lathyrus sativus]|nr:unnamed protein product [Lathyrus sativus]